MEVKEIYELLKKEFGDAIVELKEEDNSEPFIVVQREAILDVCLELRDNKNFIFNYPVNLSGMDYGNNVFGVVYHLYSFELKHRIVLKVFLSNDDLKLPSVERCWKSMNWHEREAFDMFGIEFIDHPNMQRILCPYDWEGHPLRKDYQQPEIYKGLKVPY